MRRMIFGVSAEQEVDWPAQLCCLASQLLDRRRFSKLRLKIENRKSIFEFLKAERTDQKPRLMASWWRRAYVGQWLPKASPWQRWRSWTKWKLKCRSISNTSIRLHQTSRNAERAGHGKSKQGFLVGGQEK